MQTLVNEVVSALPDLVRSYSNSTGPVVGRIRQLTNACFELGASSDADQYETLPVMADLINPTGGSADRLTANETLSH